MNVDFVNLYEYLLKDRKERKKESKKKKRGYKCHILINRIKHNETPQ